MLMVINDLEKQKANAFVARLMANPALKDFSTIQREEQIMQFLMVNSAKLLPTLSSSAFFLGKNWEQIKTILTAALYGITNKSIIADLQIIVSKLDLTFFSFLNDKNFYEEKTKKVILELLIRILTQEQARRVFTGSFTAVKSGILEKYVDNLYSMRKYIFFEITKVERLNFTKKEATNMIKLVTLLKPLIYLIIPNSAWGKPTGNGYLFQNAIATQAAKKFFEKNTFVRYQVIKSAMNSNASFIENNRIEATARLSNVLCAMCKNYKSNAKKDRGADTLTKSWLNVARKNYKFYGYDIKLLDELYNIASENGW